MELKTKLRRFASTAAALYVVFVGPLLIVLPILQAMQRWRAWEIALWVVATAAAAAIAISRR